MLRSMTGFASKTSMITVNTEQQVQITVSIKSLNSRFFETNFKIPHVINSIEVPLIKLLKKNLIRGNITISIYMSDHSAFKGTIEPSIATCKAYAQAIKTIKEHVPLEGSFSVADIMTLSNVFITPEKELDSATKDQLLATINATLASVIEEQTKEGNALLDDLNERITTMQQEIGAIEKRTTEQVEEYKTKIAQEAPQEDTEDPARDARRSALYVMLDKVDVHEEIVRFKSHLANLITLITEQTIEKGKRIDFTLQELSREINTIAAKASDALIGARAVNVKVELEKAREQAQNIV